MTMSAPRRIAVAVAVPAVVAAGAVVAVPSATAADGYHGSSFGLKVQVGLAGNTLLDQILPDVVSFPSGGEKSVLELPTELSEVATLKVLNAASAVKDQVLASNARTAQLSVLNDLVTASVLNADCTAQNLKLAGDSQVTNLAIAGTKIPIDPGPNFEVEIPSALAPFVSGGIYIDEQDTLPTGDLRVRALHVRLVVDPLGLQTALGALTEEVRKVAEQVKGAVERATGRTLEVLEQEARSARGALAPGASTAAVGRVDGPKQPGARSAQREEARAAVEKRTAQERLVAQREAEAVAAEKRAAEAEGRAAAAADAAATADAAAAPAEPTGAEPTGAEQASAEQAGAEQPGAEQPTNGGTAMKKSDRAAVPARDATTRSVDAPADAGPTSAETWQERATRVRPEQAQAAAAKAQADAAEARAAAAAARARADEARSAQANAAAPEGAASRVATKADPAAAAAPARPAAATAENENLGTVGVDVIVSQVTCKGYQPVKAAVVPPKKPAAPVEKPTLPRTGGDGNTTTALGATGLGLLVVGSAALYAARRRGRHTA